MPEKPQSATSAQVKADIDSGLTADKVRHFDPAVAPLGTDEEAAGTPTPPAALAEERELRRGIADNAGAPASPEAQSGSRAAFGWPLLLLVVLIATGIGLAMLFH